MEILAVCHTCIVEEKKGNIVYNASSPDELALVNAARYFGFQFLGRDDDNNMIVSVNGSEEITFQLLSLIEFTSSRKRMSVIVKTPDNKIKFFMRAILR